MASTILIVAADEQTRRRCEEILSPAGYILHFADDLDAALTLTRQIDPTLLLLDITRPPANLFAFIAAVRVESYLPIVLRASTQTENLAIDALTHGADDYLLATTGAKEMAARLHAIIRRLKNVSLSSGVIRVGDVAIHPEKRTAYVNHVPLNLTPTEFDLLSVLMNHPGQIFSRAELCSRVSGSVSEHALPTHIRNLRAKILPHATTDPIETVYSIGYRFRPDPVD